MAICQVCQADKKSLVGHLKIHGLNKIQYLEKFGKDADLGYQVQDHPNVQLHNATTTKVVRPPKVEKFSPSFIDGLTKEETHEYTRRYELLFDQASKDPALEATIRDVVKNEIFIARYQLKLQQLSDKMSDAKTMAELHAIVDKMQNGNIKLLQSLNLTKEKKDALNKTPESTPSRLITAYIQAVSMFNPMEREKFREEEAMALLRLQSNVDRLIDNTPRTASGGEEEIEIIEIDDE